MNPLCISCFYNQAERLITKHKLSDNLADKILQKFGNYIDKYKNDSLTSPECSCFLHRLIKKGTACNDLYKEEKKYYNNLLLSLEAQLQAKIDSSDDHFQSSLRYAVSGNIIDFGPPESFNLEGALSDALSKEPVINHSSILRKSLQKASLVLYLGDNAGEIVLDKLFIKTINHPDLHFAVRGSEVLNDVTIEDAFTTGIHKYARVISNGYDAPSTLLNRCSDNFLEIFNKADIIISKGQGNLEGLIKNTEKRIFFLLMVKCEVISEILGVRKGEIVIMDNQYLLKN